MNLFESPEETGTVKLEVLVSEETAADVEALETLFFQWKRQNGKNEKLAKICLDKAVAIMRRNPQAVAVHFMRPPSIFEKQSKELH